MYVLYVDVLFAINLIMDTIIFFLVSILINFKVKNSSLIIAGMMASFVYCVFLLTPLLKDIPSIIYSSIIPVVPILYLFRPNNRAKFIKYYMVSMMVAMLLGGGTFSIWFLLGNNIDDIGEISVLIIAIIAILLAGSFYFLFYNIRRRFILPSFEYQIKFIRNNKELILKSILDTGNLLYTPITHKPVIVVYYDDIKELMTKTEEFVSKKYCGSIQELLETDNMNCIKYIIPFNSVGNSSGVIIGIEVDEIKINRVGYSKSFKNCVVGVAMSPLFREGNYKALLHPEYILEEVG